MLHWMIFNGELSAYFSKGIVQAHTSVFDFTVSLSQKVGEFSGDKMDAAIREEFDADFAAKLIGKLHTDRVNDVPIEWEDQSEARAVAAGFWLWASDVDWEMGTLSIEGLPSDVKRDDYFFPDEELLGTEFDRADYDVEFSGMTFEASQIELLLPTAELSIVDEKTGDIGERKKAAGRPPIWEWEGALAFIVSQAQLPDGLPTGPGAQARIEDAIKGWFIDQTGDAPATSQIRKRAASIIGMIEKG